MNSGSYPEVLKVHFHGMPRRRNSRRGVAWLSKIDYHICPCCRSLYPPTAPMAALLESTSPADATGLRSKRPPSPVPFRAASPAEAALLLPPKPDRKKAGRSKPHSRTSKVQAGVRRRRSSDSVLDPEGLDSAVNGSGNPPSPRIGLLRLGPVLPSGTPSPSPSPVSARALLPDERTLQDIGNLLKRTVPASLRSESQDDKNVVDKTPAKGVEGSQSVSQEGVEACVIH